MQLAEVCTYRHVSFLVCACDPAVSLGGAGAGASMCAIEKGKCIDTSMGLTPLEGYIFTSSAVTLAFLHLPFNVLCNSGTVLLCIRCIVIVCHYSARSCGASPFNIASTR